jgi:hypothetical protein
VSATSLPTHLARISDRARLSKHLVLISALSLGAFAGAQARPLDSPETVYIDGVPCNGACQSYMAWSRKTLEENSGARASAQAADRKVSHTRMTSAVAPKRLTPLPPTREVIPLPRQAPRDLTAGLEYLVPVPEDRSLKVRAAAAETQAAAPKSPVAAPETRTAGLTTQPATPEIKAAVPASSIDKAIEAQILAATALADQFTAASTPLADEKKEVAENAGQTASILARDDTADKADNKETAAVSPPRAPDLVVLILARADIKSIADLANKDIAIEGKQDQFRDRIRSGLVAAGAPMIELRDGKASAIDRLVSGEQPAAILTLASPEAADGFPEIKGFRTFRIPLSPS